MTSLKLVTYYIALASAMRLCAGNPSSKPAFWEGTPMSSVVEEMRSNCVDGSDSMSCMKYKVATFLDTIFKKDNYQLFGDVEVRQNDFNGNLHHARSSQSDGLMDTVEQYIESHDVTFKVPLAGAKVTVSPKNINDDELNLKIKFANEGRSSVEARKSKLKKIVIPIMVFVLLKAMTLIPLALGVLGLKAFNALQLSFFSFVVSIALAIFQLCKKIATDNHHPQLATHAPWETRSFVVNTVAAPSGEAQPIVYNAYSN